MKFIYLFINIPFLWKCKIGISQNVKQRRKSVSESTPGYVLPVWVVFVPFADGLEKSMHGFFGSFRSPFRRGSGRSEWFMTIPVLPLAWLIMTFMFVIYWSPIVALVWWVVKNG